MPPDNLTQVFIGILAFLLVHKLFLSVMLDKAKKVC